MGEKSQEKYDSTEQNQTLCAFSLPPSLPLMFWELKPFTHLCWAKAVVELHTPITLLGLKWGWDHGLFFEMEVPSSRQLPDFGHTLCASQIYISLVI